MKAYFKNLLYLLLIFFLTTSLFKGIVMPELTIYSIATLIILSMGVMLAEPILKFLTIQVNFLTYFLMSSIVTVAITFLLKIFMTGFFVQESMFRGISYDFLEINSFEINSILTIIIFSVVSSFILSIFSALDK